MIDRSSRSFALRRRPRWLLVALFLALAAAGWTQSAAKMSEWYRIQKAEGDLLDRWAEARGFESKIEAYSYSYDSPENVLLWLARLKEYKWNAERALALWNMLKVSEIKLADIYILWLNDLTWSDPNRPMVERKKVAALQRGEAARKKAVEIRDYLAAIDEHIANIGDYLANNPLPNQSAKFRSALRRKDYAAARALALGMSDPDAPANDSTTMTPLMIALAEGASAELVELLLQRGANPNLSSRTSSGSKLPLEYCAKDAEIFARYGLLLFAYGANPTAFTQCGLKLVLQAFRDFPLEVAIALFRAGDSSRSVDAEGYGVYHYLVRGLQDCDDWAAVERLEAGLGFLQGNGVDIDAKSTKEGETALASLIGELSSRDMPSAGLLVQSFLDHGASIAATDSQGRDIIERMHAMPVKTDYQRRLVVSVAVRLFSAPRVDPNRTHPVQGWAGLHYAILDGQPLDGLIARGAKIDYLNPKAGNESILSFLLRSVDDAAYGLSAMRTLLEHGASPNAQDKAGLTPLMQASVSDAWAEAVSELLLRGAAVNAVSSSGRTALFYAWIRGSAEVTKRLLAAKADPEIRDSTGKKYSDYTAPLVKSQVLAPISFLSLAGRMTTLPDAQNSRFLLICPAAVSDGAFIEAIEDILLALKLYGDRGFSVAVVSTDPSSQMESLRREYESIWRPEGLELIIDPRFEPKTSLKALLSGANSYRRVLLDSATGKVLAFDLEIKGNNLLSLLESRLQ